MEKPEIMIHLRQEEINQEGRLGAAMVFVECKGNDPVAIAQLLAVLFHQKPAMLALIHEALRLVDNIEHVDEITLPRL